MKVFLNPGHAPGIDPGACNYEYDVQEADIALEVARHVQDYLEAAGVRVCGFLQDDDLAYVVDEANNSKADLFISIHCNSYSSPEPQGTETLVYEKGGRSEILAEYIQYQIISELGTVDRGVKERPRLYVLNRTNMPAVLVELAFISNEDDVQMLIDNKEEFAAAIARAVTDYEIDITQRGWNE